VFHISIWVGLELCLGANPTKPPRGYGIGLNTKQTGSGYGSASGPPFLKTYSSASCNVTLFTNAWECAGNCTTLGRNI